MGATLATSVTGGTYSITIDGVGTGDAQTAYTDYGSLGRYLLEGSWPTLGVVNQPPVASTLGTTPTSGSAPLAVQFVGTQSSDPDGIVASYNWNFGEGGTSTLANPSYTYQAAGNYTATLTVADNSGATATSSVLISVTAPPVSTKIVRVGRLSLVWVSSRKGVSGTATVTVTDAAGKVLPNVTVTGAFSGVVSRNVSGVTNRKGQVSLSTGSLPSTTRGSLTFSVTNLTISGYTYDASKNAATSATISR
jgi:PKD repeat protein